MAHQIRPTNADIPFWECKTLEEMNHVEWELLCDGCGKCCLHKIEDIDSGEILYTRVACQFLDIEKIRCRNYERRSEIVSDCVNLTPALVRKINWLPKSCAYRCLSEGRDLPWWHPLISHNSETVQFAGISIHDWAVPEKYIHLSELEAYVIDWIDQKPAIL